MLTFYRRSDCSVCDEVAGQLRELRLAHKVIQIEDGARRPADLPPDGEPPILADDGETYVGSKAIGEHLAHVAGIKDRWQQHGSDACFCDPDGEIV